MRTNKERQQLIYRRTLELRCKERRKKQCMFSVCGVALYRLRRVEEHKRRTREYQYRMETDGQPEKKKQQEEQQEEQEKEREEREREQR